MTSSASGNASSGPRARVVYTHGGGRFGNQLLRFAHWLAWAHEWQGRAEVLDLAFWPYAGLFEHWSHRPACVYPDRGGAAQLAARVRGWMPARVLRHGEWRAQRQAARWLPRLAGGARLDLNDATGEQCDLTDPAFFERAARVRRLVCSGWRFQCWPWLERHASAVRAQFVPRADLARQTERHLAPWRARHRTLVGVLIRRGDYREWCGGRFCFPVEQYANWLREIVRLHEPGAVGFVVAADEAVPPETFHGLPVLWASGSVNSGGHWFESFLQLAACDVILAPPSTFAAMGAFLGDRPLWPLVEAEQVLANTPTMPRHLFAAAEHPVCAVAVR